MFECDWQLLQEAMKTHKVKFAGYDYYSGGYDGSFNTYCGITEECSEELFE